MGIYASDIADFKVMGYRVSIAYIKPYVFGMGWTRSQQFRYFRYTAASGFIVRMFGIDFNVREVRATEKIIAYAKAQSRGAIK